MDGAQIELYATAARHRTSSDPVYVYALCRRGQTLGIPASQVRTLVLKARPHLRRSQLLSNIPSEMSAPPQAAHESRLLWARVAGRLRSGTGRNRTGGRGLHHPDGSPVRGHANLRHTLAVIATKCQASLDDGMAPTILISEALLAVWVGVSRKGAHHILATLIGLGWVHVVVDLSRASGPGTNCRRVRVAGRNTRTAMGDQIAADPDHPVRQAASPQVSYAADRTRAVHAWLADVSAALDVQYRLRPDHAPVEYDPDAETRAHQAEERRQETARERAQQVQQVRDRRTQTYDNVAARLGTIPSGQVVRDKRLRWLARQKQQWRANPVPTAAENRAAEAIVALLRRRRWRQDEAIRAAGILVGRPFRTERQEAA